MSKTILIYDSSKNNHNSYLAYSWSGYAQDSRKLSLFRYIENYSDEIKDKYLEFIHDLGEFRYQGKKIRKHFEVENDFSLWWMSLISEKSPWKSPSILDCIKLIAIEKIVKEQSPRKLIFAVSNKNAAKVLKSFCKKKNIDFEWTPNKKKYPNYIYFNDTVQKFCTCIYGFIYLFYYFVSRSGLKLSKSNLNYNNEDSIFFSSYFYNLDLHKAKEGTYYSRQWGGLPQYLNAKGYKTVHLENFVKSPAIDKVSSAKYLINLFNKENNRKYHVFLDQFLTIKSFFYINLKYMRIINSGISHAKLKAAFNLKKSEMNLWPLMRDDWFSSFCGKTTVSNLIWLRLFNEHLKKMAPQKLGFYLCEGMGWERALIHAWKKNGHGALIAVPHSTVRYWDLRYFQDKRITAFPSKFLFPVPDYYAVNGHHAYNAFLENKCPDNMLLKSEALRYQFLNNTPAENKKNIKNIIDSKMLILGDVSESETDLMLKELELFISNNDVKLNLAIKPHPACEILVSKYPLLDLSIEQNPLEDCLKDYDLIFSSNSTSASLDCYLMSKKVIIFLNKMNLNFSPLRGAKEVDFISDHNDIFAAFRSFKNESVENNYFWIDKDLNKWKKIIQKFI